MKRANSADEYVALSGEWKACLGELRKLLKATRLEETIKWGMPVYTLNNKNVVGISAFKSWTGIWFYQGVYLKDPAGVLINAQEGSTRGLRQWRFSSLEEITSQQKTIASYLEEAIENQKAGKEIKPERNKPLILPVELDQAMTHDPVLKERFEGLSPGKRREYAEHIATAKREETRQKRLIKIIPMILEGIGLSDKYRS